jgi:hypothetical protein
MPAVRDYTFSYESSTSDAGITIPVCAAQSGDLLIALAMGDTGSLSTFTTTLPTGWKILEDWLNTTPMQAYFKIASGSDTDLALAATTHIVGNETYNGSMVSFRDVDSSWPVGDRSVSTYASSNQDNSQAVGDGTTIGVSQSFTTAATTSNTNARGCFSRVRLWLKKTGSPTGNATVKIYAHSGTLGTSSVPTGAALATSNAFDVSTLTTSYQWIDFYFPESDWYNFAAATNYVLSLEYSGGDASNYVQAGYDASAPGHAGNKATATSGPTWTAQSGHDLVFEVHRFTLNLSNQAASNRVTMPTITTVRDNSLVLYLHGDSASAATPSFVEGPVTQIHGSDGAAEGHGMGWAFQKAAGTTPGTVIRSGLGSGASFKGVAAINPPASGATVVPGFVVTDNCALVEFHAGTTGFNGNTGMAATADTNYGATLGGVTANDATVAATTDSGINSFHSTAALTSSSTAGTISGAEAVLAAANRINLDTKNLLAHVRPSAVAQLQRLAGVSSGRGVWMGVRSNTASGGATTGYKIWQVLGVDYPGLLNEWVPIVINNGAGNTKATSGTLDAAVVTSIGYWVGSLATLTAQMLFGPCWLMDSTVIAGGTSTEPLGTEDIVRAVGRGKERRSAILQGKNQLLLLQDVQIGDGGTNGVYLNLDSTAIEFPSQYNATTKLVNYNSVDNKIGLKYYAGASDTIIHTNAIVSSPSRYFWGLHASSSASATYSFDGLQVIGAGTITLNKAITITGLTINSYSTIDVSDADLVSCAISGAPTENDSITTNASTSFTSCTINTTGVSSGNRLVSVANPTIFASCAFTGSASTGHAIRITTAGTYDLSGCTFTGYGADGTNSAAIYNDSGGAVTLNIVDDGNAPTIRNGAGASTNVVLNPVALSVHVQDINTGSPISGARVWVPVTSSAGGKPYNASVTISNAGTTATVTHTSHGLATNDYVWIQGASLAANNGTFQITVTNANTYTYTMGSSPGSSPTGSITSTFVVISGTTNGSGDISGTYSWAADQPVSGRVRYGAAPYYKTAPITGTISSASGLSVTANLIPDA